MEEKYQNSAHEGSENQDPQNRVFTHQDEGHPSVEEYEETITNLKRGVMASVTNIQIAADARETRQRGDWEQVHVNRLEQLEEKFEEIARRWSDSDKKVILQELQEALNNQKKLCDSLIEDKKKIINDMKQELQFRDDRYVNHLKQQTDELDLMIEKMEFQMKVLTKAYREEMAHLESIYQQECDIMLTRDKTEWEEYMKDILDIQLKGLLQRKKKVEKYEATIHRLKLEIPYRNNYEEIELNAKSQALLRDHQRVKATRTINTLKNIKQEDEVLLNNINLIYMMSRTISLQTEIKKLLFQDSCQESEFTKKKHRLLDAQRRQIQQYERLQKKIKHFAAANIRQFQQMWLTVEGELKELVGKVLVIDTVICRQLGLAWEQPAMPFVELCSPIQPKKQAVQCDHRLTDASAGPEMEAESTEKEMAQERTAAESESGAEVEQEMWMELLCDEVDFLMDDSPLRQLAPLEKTCAKLYCFLTSLGIEKEDLPMFSDLLRKHKHHQHREQSEAVYEGSDESSDQEQERQDDATTHPSPEHSHPRTFVPVLKSFLKQITKPMEKSSKQSLRFPQIEARDTLGDEAYWESIGNIISEDRLKLWATAEKALNHYHAILVELSELASKTQRLEEENKELHMGLLLKGIIPSQM